MNERKGMITSQGNPLTLLGNEVKVGERPTDVALLSNDMQTVKLSSFQGKPLVILSVPSLDTSVCDTEVRRFNQEAGSLGDDVQIIAVSADLPTAQQRWCGAAGVEWVQTLSDHREMAFGQAFGVQIKELRLLARAVFVLDPAGVLRYSQLVSEVSHEPDYDAALTALKTVIGRDA